MIYDIQPTAREEPMDDNEALRQEMMRRIDVLLSRPVLLWGRDRDLISAIRGYLVVMPSDELSKLRTYLVQREEENEHGEEKQQS